MSRRGWHLSPLQHPPAVHMCFTAQHVEVVPSLLKARTPSCKLNLKELMNMLTKHSWL